MPTPNSYKQRLLSKGGYAGESHKNQADGVLEYTWYEDLATRTCYLFDYYHDNEPLKLNDLTPDESMMIPIDLKYIVNSSQTLDKDQISYHVMLKPSQEGDVSIVPYYKEMFADRYDAHFPVGLYALIPDNNGKYNKWLIVAPANINDPQFPTYEILRCDKIIQYVYNNVKYQIAAVLRSQNSYMLCVS